MRAEPGQARRICCVGDSFVTGTGDQTGLGWTGRLALWARAAGHDVTLYNLGVRGDTSRQVATRWESEVRCRLSGVSEQGRVLFSFGVNDCCPPPCAPAASPPWRADRRVVPAESLAAATACLTKARTAWPVLMVGPPPIADALIDARIGPLDQGLAEAAAGCGVPYLSVFGPLACDPLWRAEIMRGDGAHPGAAGYRRLARLIWGWPAWRRWLMAES